MNIVIVGASGRMGRALIEAVSAEPQANLYGAMEHTGSEWVGQPLSVLGAAKTDKVINSDLDATLQGADVLIDFTSPAGTMNHLAACKQHRVKMVIGTTGLTQAEKDSIAQASHTIPIVFSPNFSVGVNLTFKLLELAARTLDDQYDIEIIEAHHRHKVDAPSGTALGMGEAIARAKGRSLQEWAVYAREGIVGERRPGSIGFATVRGGDIVGDHTALFATLGERIEITHKASSRATFACGAVRAGLWLKTQKTGLFDMQDVLGLNA